MSLARLLLWMVDGWVGEEGWSDVKILMGLAVVKQSGLGLILYFGYFSGIFGGFVYRDDCIGGF